MDALRYNGKEMDFGPVDGRAIVELLYDGEEYVRIIEPGDATRYVIRLESTDDGDGLIVSRMPSWDYERRRPDWSLTFRKALLAHGHGHRFFSTASDFDGVESNEWTRRVIAHYLNLVLEGM